MPEREKTQVPGEQSESARSGETRRLVERQTEVRKGAETYRPRPAGEPAPAAPAASTSQGDGGGPSGESPAGSSDGMSSGESGSS